MGLHFKTDANTAPEVFPALCSIAAEMLPIELNCDPAIGWYQGCRVAPDRSGSTKELWALLSALGIATFASLRRSARSRRA